MKYFYLSNIRIPTYGVIVILGIGLCNLIAYFLSKKKGEDFQNFLYIEIPAGAGAVLGAKLLTVITEAVNGNLASLSFEAVKNAGSSYYGGLFGFLLAGFLFCRWFDLDVTDMVDTYFFLLPLLHSVWKIGCFMAGCCYGIPYEGLFSVSYKEIGEMSGIPLFPVQLLESFFSFLTLLLLLALKRKGKGRMTVEIYLLVYGVSRFFLEYLRWHQIKTVLFPAQVYSLICVLMGFILHKRRRLKE